ncbi:MAG: hypothetical protein LCH60_06990 [Actinobacteria bacterium]|nr:hypothetical protein [Actinomycetota bacterium]
MAKLTVSPLVFKDIFLSIGTGTPDDFARHVSEAIFEPKSETITWQGAAPDAGFSDQGAPTWTLKISFAQDWTTANSLVKYLMANIGKQVPCTLKPNASATTPVVVTATVICSPPPIGGTVNKVMEGSVTLGVVGSPAVA